MYHTKQFQKTNAFTLVELIVVIVILAILATIAFLSFGSQSSSARDSTRLSDLGSISKGLMVYQSTKSTYPTPDSAVPIYLGSTATGTLGYQGIVGSSVKSNIKAGADGFVDPLDKKEYTYSLNKAKTKYRLMTFLENKDSVALKTNIIDSTFAVLDTRIPYLKGDNVAVVYSNTGGTILPIQEVTNIPGVSSTGVNIEVGVTNPEVVFQISNSATAAPLTTDAIGSYTYTDSCPAEYAWNGKVMNSGFNARHPVYSPDGKTIVYINFSQNKALYIKNADDDLEGHPINSVKSDSPSFSPDGKYIVYRDENANIFKINSDNIDKTLKGTGIVDGYNSNFPTYSPDGKYIYYSSYQNFISTIYYKDADNEDNKFYGTGLTGLDSLDGSEIAISSDGINLVYSTDAALYITKLQSGSPGTQIGSGSFSDREFSPDGKSLIYSLGNSDYHLFIKSVNDMNYGTELNSLNGSEWPSVSPDGKFLFYDANSKLYKRCME